MDADDRPTNATDDTPLPPTLFAQRAPSLNPSWPGWLEEYSPSSFDNRVSTNINMDGVMALDPGMDWDMQSVAWTKTQPGVNAVPADDSSNESNKSSALKSDRFQLSQDSDTSKSGNEMDYGIQNKEERPLAIGFYDFFREGSTHFSTRTSPISAHILTCVPTQSLT